MHIFLVFSKFAYFREFLHVHLALQSRDLLNLISESIDDIPPSVDKHSDFHIPKISLIIFDDLMVGRR